MRNECQMNEKKIIIRVILHGRHWVKLRLLYLILLLGVQMQRYKMKEIRGQTNKTM